MTPRSLRVIRLVYLELCKKSNFFFELISETKILGRIVIVRNCIHNKAKEVAECMLCYLLGDCCS